MQNRRLANRTPKPTYPPSAISSSQIRCRHRRWYTSSRAAFPDQPAGPPPPSGFSFHRASSSNRLLFAATALHRYARLSHSRSCINLSRLTGGMLARPPHQIRLRRLASQSAPSAGFGQRSGRVSPTIHAIQIGIFGLASGSRVSDLFERTRLGRAPAHLTPAFVNNDNRRSPVPCPRWRTACHRRK